MNRITWLASYPKSGNTWLRVFLSNFRSGGNVPADINRLDVGQIADRDLFDNLLGVESSDMTHDEIERYRPQFYRRIASQAQQPLFFKIHDAYTMIPGGEPLIPADTSRGAIYLVRNPLDIAISFAHHSSLTLDESIDRMADDTFAFSSSPDRLHRHLKQTLLSWSRHVLSWLDQEAIAVYLMRYEDMHAQPLEAFTNALQFLGMDTDAHRVRQALGFSCFDALQNQEQTFGFRERPSTAASFFRAGRVGQWRDVLTWEQVNRVVSAHRSVMQRLGYLSDDGVIPSE